MGVLRKEDFDQKVLFFKSHQYSLLIQIFFDKNSKSKLLI